MYWQRIGNILSMKLINSFFIYILIPVLILFVAIRSGNWYSLFWIACYAAGVVISKFHLWIFFPIPLLFTLWYWYTYGFSPGDFVSSCFFSMALGIVLVESGKIYYRFVGKILPEQMNNIEYNEKVDEFNKRLDEYRRTHPSEKLTSEIVEKIRGEVFF